MDPMVLVRSRSSDLSGCHLPIPYLWEQLFVSLLESYSLLFIIEEQRTWDWLNEHFGSHGKRLFVLKVGVVFYWRVLITDKNNLKWSLLLCFKALLKIEMEIQYFIWMLVHLSSLSFEDLSSALYVLSTSITTSLPNKLSYFLKETAEIIIRTTPLLPAPF